MWNIIQCSTQGRSHVKDDIPCQDKTFSYKDDKLGIIALADGAGSAKYSHFGAERITQFICEYIKCEYDSIFNNPDGAAFKIQLIDVVNEEIAKLAFELECEKKDLASTLLVVAVKEDTYILLHIGDGVIGYLKGNDLKVASAPENGEFVNTTVFTTSTDALHTMKVMKGTLKNITGFLLMSDGTETSLYNKKNNSLAPALKRVMCQMKIMDSDKIQDKLQNSFDTVIKNATVDDCSIAIIEKKSGECNCYEKLLIDEKYLLLGLSSKNKGTLKKADDIMKCLVVPTDILSLSKKVYVAPKYLRKYIMLLENSNMIIKDNNKYVSIFS